MKGLLKALAVVALLVVVGKYGYDFYMKGAVVDRARNRVSSMLNAMQQGKEQEALCQWAVGRPIMSQDEMKAYVDRFDRWRRQLQIMDVQTFSIQRVEQGPRGIEVDCFVNGQQLKLEVTAAQPVSVRED